MHEESLERMEGLLTQLVAMVGHTNTRMDQMEARMDQMEARMGQMDARMDKMDARMDRMEENSARRHDELLYELRLIKIDQDFVWDKAVRNEREIIKIREK